MCDAVEVSQPLAEPASNFGSPDSAAAAACHSSPYPALYS